ncbi:MAG: choice-of-anchor J domain-containing protein [Candidatus Thermoplasmatota archaeon]|nr:choice-of-anchor J domain-containing protein [Candidatus Thermoplasmatota archaeon]
MIKKVLLSKFTLIFIFSLNSLLAQTPYTLWFEDWESTWIVDWHVDGGTWEVGLPTSGPDTTYNGLNCAATILAGNYAEPVDSRLIRHTTFVVPPASDNPRLRFWHWYNFNEADYGNIQISTDNGNNWETISTSYTWSGSAIWTYPFIDLSPFADSTVQIAFYFHSHRVGSYSDVGTGWYIDDINLITGPILFKNTEDFESGIGDWASERGTWEIGPPSSGPGSAYSEQNCAATNLNGNYAEPVDSRLISPSFVVPSASEDPALQFWHWYSFNIADYGIVQIKVNNNQWQTISNQFTNTSSGAWTPFYVSLSSYADSTVQVAFNFHSRQDGSYSDVSSGWYIDDIKIIGLPTGVAERNDKNISEIFVLYQNYPNPFNPFTTIEFSLPKTSRVILKVYNVLGEEISTLVSDRLEAGSYSYQWDASNLASGVYLCRLQACNFTEIRKMILIQ